METYFDDEGNLREWVTEKLEREGKLSGSDALAYLADKFAGCTHCNYDGDTLFTRVDKSLEVEVKK